MKLVTLIFVFVMCSTGICAQGKMLPEVPDSLYAQASRALTNGAAQECLDLSSQLSELYTRQNLPFDSLTAKMQIKAGLAHRMLRDNEASLINFRKALSFIESTNQDLAEYKFQAYKEMALSHKRASQLDSAVTYSLKAIMLGQETFGVKHLKLHNVYNNLGNVYRLLGQFDDALQSHGTALEIRKREYAPDHFRIGDSYNNTALVYHDLFAFGKARIYNLEALKYYRGDTRLLKHRQSLVHYNIARIHYDLEENEQGLTAVDKAIGIMKELEMEGISFYAEMLTLKTNCLSDLGRYPEAEKVLNQSIEKKKRLLPADHLNWNYTYSAAAIVAAGQKDYTAALSHLDNALAVLRKHYDAGHPEIVQVYNNMAGYAILGEDQTAAEEYIATIESLLKSVTNGQKVIAEEQKLLVSYRKALLDELVYNKSEQPDNLFSAINNMEDALSAMRNIRRSGVEQKSRLFITDNHQYLVEKAAELYLSAHQYSDDISFAEKALQVLDKNKSSLLKDAVRNNASAQFAGIPESIRTQEFDLKKRLGEIKESMTEANESGKSITAKDYETSIAEFDSFLAKLENDYPKYYDFFYKDRTVDISDITDYARSNDLIFLEYFVQQNAISCFRIDADGLFVSSKDLGAEQLKTTVDEVRKMISNAGTTDLLNENLMQLHTALIADFVPATANGHIVVIPDKSLFLLPFEILQGEGQPDFLLQKHAISYAYSLDLWQIQTAQKIKKAPYAFAGFAPDYQSATEIIVDDPADRPMAMLLRSEPKRLPGALAAVASIGQLTGGMTRIGAEASEANFKKEAEQYRILHCAVHAISDSNDPLASSLLFQPLEDAEDDQLTVREIYRMNFNAELAVLSACNTGWGKLDNSEGLESIGYAFAYAGVPSNVMSLWKVPDESTSKIMQSFYQYLQQGLTKDVSLQKAKQDYLNNIVDPQQANPLYWAGFVINGNTQPIDFSNSSSRRWLAAIGLMVLIVFLFLWYRSRNNF